MKELELKEERFYLIVLLTTYVYLKEHYNDDFKHSIEKKSSEDIDQILSLLRPLEKYITIPDKREIINRAFGELEDIYCCDNKGKESTFFNRIKGYAQQLNFEEKEEILHIIFYVINTDNKITSPEKEALLTIASSLGIDYSYAKIVSSYKKSTLKKPFSVLKMLMITSITILPLLGILYYLSLEKSKDEVHIFEDKKVMFSKLTFNRFAIYQNKYKLNSTHSAKQAIFNIYGTAEVGFDPKNIDYDTVTKTITYHLPPKAPYRVEIDSKVKLIDEAKPMPISSKEAEKLAVGVGIVGGIAGAKVGSTLGSIYPFPGGKIIGSLVGGIGVGTASGILAFKGLDGLKISKDISRDERKIIINGSKERIKNLLELSPELTKSYQKRFERYIKAWYASHGLEVIAIDYDKSNIDKGGK